MVEDNGGEYIMICLEELQERLTDYNILYPVCEALLGDNATPENIHYLSEDIKRVPLDEDSYSSGYLYDTSDGEDGPGFIGAALGIGRKHAKKMVSDSKSASVVLRALRNKYEEVAFKQSRAAAERRGFFATVLFTIRKAIYWICKKFKDLTGYAKDLIKGNPENSSRAKRDYIWLRNREEDYLAANTNWFL